MDRRRLDRRGRRGSDPALTGITRRDGVRTGVLHRARGAAGRVVPDPVRCRRVRRTDGVDPGVCARRRRHDLRVLRADVGSRRPDRGRPGWKPGAPAQEVVDGGRRRQRQLDMVVLSALPLPLHFQRCAVHINQHAVLAPKVERLDF